MVLNARLFFLAERFARGEYLLEQVQSISDSNTH